MLYESKWSKLSVVTFRWSAAHQSLEVRQLGKQPGSQVRCPGGTCWAPNGICALCPNALTTKGPVSKHLPPRKCYSVSEGMLQLFPRHLLLLFTCFLPKVPRSGRREFSSGGDIAESANVLFGMGWKSMIFRFFLFLLAYAFSGQGIG